MPKLIFFIAFFLLQASLSYSHPTYDEVKNSETFNLTLLGRQPSFTQDNALLVTKDGKETTEWRFKILSEAKQSIEIVGNYCGGEPFLQILSLLDQLLESNPHLQVHFILTPILMDETDLEMLALITERYPEQFHALITETIPLLTSEWVSMENHTKMIVVDEKYFITGGTSMKERTDFNDHHDHHILWYKAKDMDIVGKGPLAKSLRLGFYRLYNLWETHIRRGLMHWVSGGRPVIPNHYHPVEKEGDIATVSSLDQSPDLVHHCKCKLTLSSPRSNFRACTREYIRVLRQAKSHINIGHLFFHPAPELYKVLVEKTKEGVPITVITNGAGDNSPSVTRYFGWANRIHYYPVLVGHLSPRPEGGENRLLLDTKTTIYEYNLPDLLYHKKILTVDHKTAIIGSYNLGKRSDIGDCELTVTIESKELVEHIEKILDRDIESSQLVDGWKSYLWHLSPIHNFYGSLQLRWAGLL